MSLAERNLLRPAPHSHPSKGDIMNVEIKGSELFVDEKLIFTLPLPTQWGIQVAGHLRTSHRYNDDVIVVGASKCCSGHLYCLRLDGKGDWELYQILAPRINCRRVIPVVFHEDMDSPGISWLAVGMGCACKDHAVAYLMNDRYPSYRPVLSTDRLLMEQKGKNNVNLGFRAEEDGVHLDLFVHGRGPGPHERVAQRVVKAMTELAPDQPLRTGYEPFASIDLSHILKKLGVNVPATAKLNEQFKAWHV